MTRVLLVICLMNTICESVSQTAFTDVTANSGINHAFRVFQGTFGGGVAVLDYNNDGFEDLFIAGGLGTDSFYRNNGDGTFSDVTNQIGLAINDTLISQGAASADVNRDGFVDLYVTTIASFNTGREIPRASDILYINNGDGTFSDQSAAYGISLLKTFSTGASFGDINADGYPDLYVGNYFDQFSGNLDKINGGTITGEQRPSDDHLYLNVGGQYFKRMNEVYGLESANGFGFGAVFTDFDNDHDLDIYVINDFGGRATSNLLYRNNFPEKNFTELSELLNVNYRINAMGVAIGDYDKDGWLDYFVSNISVSPFAANQGPSAPFSQISSRIGTGFTNVSIPNGGSVAPVSWGAIMFDYDNDTDVDLFINNGALNPSVIPNPNLFLENDGGRFLDRSMEFGLNDYGIGRGAATFDYDNDGDLDLFVVNQSPVNNAGVLAGSVSSKLYRNDTQMGNWLKVKLEGVNATTRGLGSRVIAVVNGERLIREIDGGSSHESQNSAIAHFGLNISTEVDSIIVNWVGGNSQYLTNIQANQIITIREDIEEIPSPHATADVSVFPSYFDNEIVIRYELPEFTHYDLEVIDQQGRRVELLIENRQGFTGIYNWRVPEALASGVYFFVVTTNAGRYVTRGVKL